MSFIMGGTHELFHVAHDFSYADSLPFPIGVGSIKRRTPTGGNLNKRQYVVGGHTANLMVDEQFRCVRQSIPKPEAAPTVSVGAGSTAQICYTRFYDEVAGERGPLSSGKVLTGSTTRAWSALPTTVPGDRIKVEGTTTFAAGTLTGVGTNYDKLRPGDRIAVSTALTRWARIRSIFGATSMTIDDTGMAGAGVSLVAKAVPRCSHIELWVAVSGALPRFVMRVRLGTTSVTESTATLALGEAETESFEAMPTGSGSVLYNQRQLVYGVVGREDTIFLSQIGFPERYAGLSFHTEYNEPVVGAFTYRKYVVILCPDSSYVLEGVTDEDYVLDGLEPDIGGFGPAIIAEGVAFVPGRKGMQAFNGAFHRVIPTRRSEWVEEHTTYTAAYEGGFLAVNPHDETVQFYPQREHSAISKATCWVGQYSSVGPQQAGAIVPPEWFLDTQVISTEDVTSAGYLTPSGARAGKFYRATDQGRVWVEDESGVTAYTGTAIIALRAENFGVAGGGKHDEGKKLDVVWSHLRSEKSAWVLQIWPGDEYAYPLTDQLNAVPKYSDSVVESDIDDGLTQPLGTHAHPRVDRDGRTFTLAYRFTDPLNVVFAGWGGRWQEPGVATRPAKLTDGG